MKTVAVIMSVYKNDQPEYFRNALESLLCQTYGIDNIHIYQAIDGEIPGGLEKVITEYREFFFKVVRIKSRGGLACALNRLIEVLEDEEYVLRMDSDDVSRSDRVENQITFMDDNKNVGISGMAMAEFDETGKKTLRSYPLDHQKLIATMPKASPFAHPTVCFRKSVLTMLKKYSTDYNLCEDIEMWFRAAERGVVFANLPEVGLDFRLQKNSFERRSLKKAKSEFVVYWYGTIKLSGVNIMLVFPVLRFLSRIVPKFMIRILYKTSIRNKCLN